MRSISARRSPDKGAPEPFEDSAVDRPAREGAAGVDSSAGTFDATAVGTSAGATGTAATDGDDALTGAAS